MNHHCADRCKSDFKARKNPTWKPDKAILPQNKVKTIIETHFCCSSAERISGFVSSDWIVLYRSVVRPFLRKQNGYTHIHVMESIIPSKKLQTKAFLCRVYSGCAVNAWSLLSLETLSPWRIFSSSMCVFVLQEVLWIKISGSISTSVSRKALWTTSYNKSSGTTFISAPYPVSNSRPSFR